MGKLRLEAVALVAAFLFTAAPAVAAPPPACYGDGAPATTCLVNEARAAMGLRELRPHRRLKAAASDYAERMAREGFFAHDDPRGRGPTERMLAAAYGSRRADRVWSAGETLGRGTGVLAAPHTIVYGWLASPSHRRILLGRSFKHVGVGIAEPPRELGRLPQRTYVLYAGTRKHRR